MHRRNLPHTSDPAIRALDRNAITRSLFILPETYRLTINYDNAFSTMVRTCKCEFIHQNIKQMRYTLPRTGKQTFTTRLIRCTSDSPTGEVLRGITLSGFYPATVEQLVAFCTNHPDFQRKHPILALGSTLNVGGHPFVVYASGSVMKRFISLNTGSHMEWSQVCRFLVAEP